MAWYNTLYNCCFLIGLFKTSVDSGNACVVLAGQGLCNNERNIIFAQPAETVAEFRGVRDRVGYKDDMQVVEKLRRFYSF